MLRVAILSVIMMSVIVLSVVGSQSQSVMVTVASVFAPQTLLVWMTLKQSWVFLINQVGVAEETKNLLAWMALKPFRKIHKTIFFFFLCYMTPSENFYKWHLWQLWHLASLKVLPETSHPFGWTCKTTCLVINGPQGLGHEPSRGLCCTTFYGCNDFCIVASLSVRACQSKGTWVHAAQLSMVVMIFFL
jgi:hypothetical protein